MERHMNKAIKDVIVEYPRVGEILEDYGVGCVTCSVGTCLLKDIISIHNLSKDVELELMSNIEKAIYPDRDIKVENKVLEKSKAADSSKTEQIKVPVKIEYALPIKQLVDEHDNIKILLENIPKICNRMVKSGNIDKDLVLKCVEFIRMYADKYHHSKEEDILFKYADETSDIIKAMHEDHNTARGYVRQIVKGVEEEDLYLIIENLTDYGKLLKQHIKKEDEILYPYIERMLSKEQLEKLDEEFDNVNKAVINGFHEDWNTFLSRL